jgi:hydroxyacylglutathione hydrolase
MKRGVKRGLWIAAAVLLAIIAVPVGIVASAFIGTSAIEDGRELGSSVRIVKDGFVSIGFIDLGDGKIALVDAGNDPTGKALLAELARRKLGPDAVTTVLLTHGHGDHMAGIHVLPSAAVYALAADVDLAEGRTGGHGTLTRFMPVKPTGVKVTRALTDGEVLTLGSRKVRVFAVPGHTAGSAAYLVDGVLFLGDSAGASKDGKILPAPAAFSDDPAQNRASLKALADRLKPEAADVKFLVPAHSGVLVGLGPLLAFTP